MTDALPKHNQNITRTSPHDEYFSKAPPTFVHLLPQAPKQIPIYTHTHTLDACYVVSCRRILKMFIYSLPQALNRNRGIHKSRTSCFSLNIHKPSMCSLPQARNQNTTIHRNHRCYLFLQRSGVGGQGSNISYSNRTLGQNSNVKVYRPREDVSGDPP